MKIRLTDLSGKREWYDIPSPRNWAEDEFPHMTAVMWGFSAGGALKIELVDHTRRDDFRVRVYVRGSRNKTVARWFTKRATGNVTLQAHEGIGEGMWYMFVKVLRAAALKY